MRKQPVYLLLALASLFLCQMACTFFDFFFEYTEAECLQKGGVWRVALDTGEEWCELATPGTQTPTTPVPLATPGADDCRVPASTYTLAYTGFEQTSGSGGVSCSADFVFTNLSAAPVNLILYTSWDNDAMQFAGWRTYLVPAGQPHTEQVSRTDYTDGTATYARVERLLVIRAAPECADYLLDSNQDYWEAQAGAITFFGCQ